MAPRGEVAAVYFDGQTAARHAVWIAPSPDGLGLRISPQQPGGIAPVTWRFTRLRAIGDATDGAPLTVTQHAETGDETPRDPARLVIGDREAALWLRRECPELARRDHRPGTARRIVLRLGAAAGAVVLMLFVILPNLANFLADTMPVRTEVRFGRSVMAQLERLLGAERLGGLHCNDLRGRAALQKMADRVAGDRALDYDLGVTVFDVGMLNAFAVPGGQVVIFDGLLKKAGSPEEVAAVLGHEIGHVAARDPTRLSLRAAGSAGILSIVLGDVTGGTLLAVVGEHMMQASYTREAEAAADAYALALLNDSRISSDGLADFFDKIAAEAGGELPEYLSTHPQSAGRAAGARANAARQRDGGMVATPVLTDAEWQALKAICDG